MKGQFVQEKLCGGKNVKQLLVVINLSCRAQYRVAKFSFSAAVLCTLESVTPNIRQQLQVTFFFYKFARYCKGGTINSLLAKRIEFDEKNRRSSLKKTFKNRN